jgi:uncharacterized membrane protein YraQ (UPF0718 family)
MEPDFCPACGRPRRQGVSFCTTCNYFLGQPALQPPAATQRAAGLSPELVLVLLIAAAVLVALGVLLTAPAS